MNKLVNRCVITNNLRHKFKPNKLWKSAKFCQYYAPKINLNLPNFTPPFVSKINLNQKKCGNLPNFTPPFVSKINYDVDQMRHINSDSFAVFLVCCIFTKML